MASGRVPNTQSTFFFMLFITTMSSHSLRLCSIFHQPVILLKYSPFVTPIRKLLRFFVSLL